MPLNALSTLGTISLTSSTATVTTDYLGMPIVLNRAAGITVTLPASSGSGARYEFFIGTTLSSNSYIIKVANSTDVMAGTANVETDNASDAVVGFTTGASDDTITFNGTTTGGAVGDRVLLVDIKSGTWAVSIQCRASGTEVTPFSATV